MTTFIRSASNRIEVLSDRSKTKIRDPCATGGINKDIWLETCQYNCGTGHGKTTYSLEITMNYVAGVEVIKALSDVR